MTIFVNSGFIRDNLIVILSFDSIGNSVSS